jgi:hypothetical protein
MQILEIIPGDRDHDGEEFQDCPVWAKEIKTLRSCWVKGVKWEEN